LNVVAFNGSARRNGNTATLVRHLFGPLEKAGIECELIQMAGTAIRGCRACARCIDAKDRRCSWDDDPLNDYIAAMEAADGIVLASPTYFADVSAEMKAVIDRAGYVARANDDMLQRKVGAAVVAVRRAGSIHAFDTINHFFFISQMVVPGSRYWNLGIGRDRGEVAKDEEGLETMEVLGRNMAWVLQRLRG